jgi:hypothetical protein
VANPAFIQFGQGYKTISSEWGLNYLKGKEAMTVKELHTFTDAELDLLEDALRIAADTLARRSDDFRAEAKTFLGGSHSLDSHAARVYARSSDMRALQLKIEAGR